MNQTIIKVIMLEILNYEATIYKNYKTWSHCHSVHARQSQETKITVKQLLLWSHIIYWQGQRTVNLAKLSPCHLSTSSTESGNNFCSGATQHTDKAREQ